MAAYSYKEVMYRDDFQAAIEPAMKSVFKTETDYDGDANYDGDGWVVAAFLLEQKDAELARLRALLTETGQKAIEAAAENKRLRGTLTRIAMQQKTDELEEPENADFEGGYDAIIEDAREALGK